MLRSRELQIFRLARSGRLAAHVRHASSSNSRSPRDLYNHLSQYIVGQERAKKVLSVAVFNHYQRIAPLVEPQYETKETPSYTDTASPPQRGTRSKASTSLTADIPLPRPGHPTYSLHNDSRSFTRPQSTEPPSLDPSRATTIDTDPTLIHELTADTRERDWAQDGYFNSRQPPPFTPLSKALRRRRTPRVDDDIMFPVSDSATSTYTDIGNIDGEIAERVRTSSMEDTKSTDVPPFTRGPPPPTPLLHAESESKSEDVQDLRRTVEIEKSNVLMIGPTGTGKTLMTKTLARILNVPFASCDATTYTSAGYVGEDVENCILRLLQAAEYDVARAEVGIIHLDEIDKLARRGAGDGLATWGGGRDVGGEGVQQAFLRLLEGTTVTLSAKPPPVSSGSSGSSPHSGSNGSGFGQGKDGLDTWDAGPMKSGFGAQPPPGMSPKKGVRDGLPGFGGGSSSGGKGETFVVDTSNILFICSGAFVGLENLVNSRIGKGSIGFGATLPRPPPYSNGERIASDVDGLKGLSTPDLTNYGLIPEFLGRLPIISTLHPLSVADLIRILTKPRNALIKQYQAIFESYGSELVFTRKGLEAIANEGLSRGGGARGLRGVLEEVLADAMFDVPGSGVRYCLVTEAVVKKEREAIYFSRGQKFMCEREAAEEDGTSPPPNPADWEDAGEDGKIRATG